MPALESRRVRTQPLTVTGASAGAFPPRITRMLYSRSSIVVYVARMKPPRHWRCASIPALGRVAGGSAFCHRLGRIALAKRNSSTKSNDEERRLEVPIALDLGRAFRRTGADEPGRSNAFASH